jgi:hypothetical protein
VRIFKQKLNFKHFQNFISAAGMTVEILPFPYSESEVSTRDDFVRFLYENSKIKRALAEVVPWLYEQGAFELPQ